MTPLTDIRVVLVRPRYPGNIGATARVMRNFGLSQLVLVSPVAKPNDSEARRMSTHGESILSSAKIVESLADALSDCRIVLGTSSITEGFYRADKFGPPERVLPALLETSPGALVFGPEPTGLTNAELAQCHSLIQIPADPTYSALNLAQAVAVCLYELRRQWQSRSESSLIATDAPVDHEMQERMFAQLRDGLEAIHFLFGDKADVLFHGLRQLIARAQPTEQEVKLLFGLARQLHWIADQRGTPET